MRYTELQMGNKFYNSLDKISNLSFLGEFSMFEREIDCYRGRPDFIGIKNNVQKNKILKTKNFGFVDSYVLANLKRKSPRTLNYIIKKSGFSNNSVKKSLSKLQNCQLIEKKGEFSYVLSPRINEENVEFYTFELKLSDSKKAITQAMQNKSFANVSIIVIPPEKVGCYEKFLNIFNKWGLGLLSFDINTKEICTIKKPKNTQPLSRFDYFYTVLKLNLI